MWFSLDFTNDVVQIIVCVVTSLIAFGFSSLKRPTLRIVDLKVAAQKSLGQGFLRLIAPDGHVLDPQQSLEDVGLQEGDAWWRSAKTNLLCSSIFTF